MYVWKKNPKKTALCDVTKGPDSYKLSQVNTPSLTLVPNR